MPQSQESRRISKSAVEEEARSLLSGHSSFRGGDTACEFEPDEKVLIVRGRVSTFYLKQLLQTLLKQLDGVIRVDNRVDVATRRGRSNGSVTGSR